MKALLTLVLCTLSLGIRASELPKDTINCYVIDNVAISKFDGTQLEGKTIDKYIIACKDQGKSVLKTHVILTKEFKTDGPHPYADAYKNHVVSLSTTGKMADADVIGLSDCKNFPNARILLDGKEIKADELWRMKPDDIANITVLKPGSKAARAVANVRNMGDKGKTGIIIISTMAKAKTGQIVFINGQKTSEDEMKKLKPEDISSVTIIKNDGVNEVRIVTK